MSYPSDNPLTPDHAASLTKAIESAAATRALLEKCKRCNVPMDDLHAENEAQHAIAVALRSEFYPHAK